MSKDVVLAFDVYGLYFALKKQILPSIIISRNLIDQIP